MTSPTTFVEADVVEHPPTIGPGPEAIVTCWDPKAGIGTVIATMIPYSVVFLLVWVCLFAIWFLLGIPVGPGATLFIPVPAGG